MGDFFGRFREVEKFLLDYKIRLVLNLLPIILLLYILLLDSIKLKPRIIMAITINELENILLVKFPQAKIKINQAQSMLEYLNVNN